MAVQVDLTVQTEPMGENDRPMPVLEIQQRTGAFGYHGINARKIRRPRLVDGQNLGEPRVIRERVA